MKKLITGAKATLMLCAIFILPSHRATAQQFDAAFKNKTVAQRAQYQTSLMKSKLKLDTVQLIKVQGVNVKYASQFDKILKSNDAKTDRIKQAMALQKAKDAELKTIFTASQFGQYQAIENELIARVKAKAGELK